MRSRLTVYFASVACMAACGGSPEPEPEPPAPTPTTRYDMPVPTGPVAFSVHEWGFIGHHYAAADTEHSLATGRGRPPEPEPQPAVRPHTGMLHGDEGKPVIYVHLDEPTREFEIRATLDVGEGRMVEILPTAVRDGTRYRWNLEVRSDSCSVAERYPNGGRDWCGGRSDDYCEAAELATYETDDGACLRVDGEDWNHLFYRTRTLAELPLQVRRTDDGFVAVTTAPLPGRLMRIRRGQRPSETHVMIVPAPAPGAEVRLPDETSSSVIVGLRYLESELEALGMTTSERAAFIRAWSSDLFGSDVEQPNRVQDIRAPDNLRPKEDALVYFMPEAAVQAMAPLAFEPPAREVRRAILVRIDLGAAPEATDDSVDIPFAGRPRRPRLSWADTRTLGPLAGDAVQGQARNHASELRSCFDQALAQDPRSTGLAELRYSIGTNGSVSDANVQWRAGGSQALESCLVAAIRTWSFEPSPSTSTRVFQPMLFDP